VDPAGSKSGTPFPTPGRDCWLRRTERRLPASNLLRTRASHQLAGRALPTMRCAGRVPASLMPGCRGRQAGELAEPPRGGASAGLRVPARPSSSHRRPPPRAPSRRGQQSAREGSAQPGPQVLCWSEPSEVRQKGVRLRCLPGRFRVRRLTGPCTAQQDHIATSFHADCCCPYHRGVVCVRLVKAPSACVSNTHMLQPTQRCDDNYRRAQPSRALDHGDTRSHGGMCISGSIVVIWCKAT